MALIPGYYFIWASDLKLAPFSTGFRTKFPLHKGLKNGTSLIMTHLNFSGPHAIAGWRLVTRTASRIIWLA
jgi:hypothetical protein